MITFKLLLPLSDTTVTKKDPVDVYKYANSATHLLSEQNDHGSLPSQETAHNKRQAPYLPSNMLK